MGEADDILAKARAREEVRTGMYTPPDYAMVNKAFSKQKARLTRAINSGDPDRVVVACRDTVREWSQPPFNGVWPDDWSRWQCALDDALGWRSSVQLEDL